MFHSTEPVSSIGVLVLTGVFSVSICHYGSYFVLRFGPNRKLSHTVLA